jgi:hypothetical protein
MRFLFTIMKYNIKRSFRFVYSFRLFMPDIQKFEIYTKNACMRCHVMYIIQYLKFHGKVLYLAIKNAYL